MTCVNVLDRLDELDYRLHLRPRPGTGGAGTGPLSPARIRVLRAIWAIWIVLTVLAVIAAVAWDRWVLLAYPLGVAIQLCVIPRDHRRQVFGRAPRD
jgi:hypothetical protein